jgi:hypothetical protein
MALRPNAARNYARLGDVSTTIRTRCERCGTVDVPVDSALLEVPLEGDARNVALLTCPACDQTITVPVGERATRLLSSAGISVAMAQPAPDRTPVTDS